MGVRCRYGRTPREKKVVGFGLIFGGLVRDHFLFFFGMGFDDEFCKTFCIFEIIEVFCWDPRLFCGPAAFCGTERGRGPLWGCRAEWSKMAAGSLKIVEGYKQIDFKGRENCRRLCKIVKDPIPNKKNGSDFFEPLTLYRTHRLYRESKFSYVLKNTSLKVI